MNWKFWSKKPSRAPRIFEIPADKVQEILRLMDNHMRAPHASDREAKYLLWKAVMECVPEVAAGEWKVTTPNAFTVVIEEII
jgi:hypothetical protein